MRKVAHCGSPKRSGICEDVMSEEEQIKEVGKAVDFLIRKIDVCTLCEHLDTDLDQHPCCLCIFAGNSCEFKPKKGS